MVAGVQTAKAQKVVLHMQGDKTFSAIITDDPDGIGGMNNEQLKVKNEGGSWYDFGGCRVPFPVKGGIYVTKGKSVLK